MEKICKNCEYYRNNFGYGQCYGQKNVPQVDDNECYKSFNKKSTPYREQFVGETDEQYEEYKKAHDGLFNDLEEKLAKSEVKCMKINKEEILNVKISKPSLYVEDHGVLTFDFILEGSGFGCCYGGYCIGHPIDYTASESGLIAMMHIMDVVGVNRWEDLDGKYCRVKSNGWGSTITCIGNLIDDDWFDIKEFFENYKKEDNGND